MIFHPQGMEIADAEVLFSWVMAFWLMMEEHEDQKEDRKTLSPHIQHIWQLSKDDGLYRISCGSNKKPQFS